VEEAGGWGVGVVVVFLEGEVELLGGFFDAGGVRGWT